mmetsp:Transcript_14499/g.21832  ORF Transcript_14499/g.21832 Transcript_14499/m.21832 type:complete len:360 (+) Transcript_14499:196-1275(+)|eukprot:CAMPEP_0185020926 /NCGR_PEP_ID=MMETSP1103-20130426/3577_1 /TAXON_ID=36769 /ORGANISM="Paraphysomonas bandaiensis, Strain Caron Lab Isolate" /LENGTH=359 /DNA_ID=CAMNT_0027552129 /DNA_START=124 /DNA_END=1203 /DNA_ORIENTATION=+
MGCIHIKEFQMNDSIPGCDALAMEAFEILSLSQKDLNYFFTAFLDIDADDSGHIRADEFFAYFRIEQTPFNKRIFIDMDTDNSGYLNFCEFVCAMWNFLSLLPEKLGSFAYYIFDDDKSGSLDHMELKKLVETIHHKSYDTNPAVKKYVQDVMANCGGARVSITHFEKCCSENKGLTAPLISLQYRIRESFIGHSFWRDISARRAADHNQSQPDFIQKLSQNIDAKRKEKSRILMMERKLAKEQERIDAAKSKKGNRRDGRRRTSIMFSFYAKGGATPSNTLPPAPRRRRSSFIRPNLVKNGEKKREKASKKKKKVQPVFTNIEDAEDFSSNIQEEKKQHEGGGKNGGRKHVGSKARVS